VAPFDSGNLTLRREVNPSADRHKREMANLSAALSGPAPNSGCCPNWDSRKVNLGRPTFVGARSESQGGGYSPARRIEFGASGGLGVSRRQPRRRPGPFVPAEEIKMLPHICCSGNSTDRENSASRGGNKNFISNNLKPGIMRGRCLRTAALCFAPAQFQCLVSHAQRLRRRSAQGFVSAA